MARGCSMHHALLSAVCVAGLLDLNHGGPLLANTRTVDVIRGYGYNAKEYSVLTADGYELALTQIQSPALVSRLPVLMVHGVLAASDQWVMRGPSRDLAFILADSGHDVWLGDQRGNCFSRNHTYLNTSQAKFWDFSFHESGLYDLPAFVETVLRVSGSRQLHYVGHSMGTSVFFVMSSLRPEYNRFIRSSVHLSPIAFSPAKPFSPAFQTLMRSANLIAEGLRRQHIYDFLPRTSNNQWIYNYLCSERSRIVCTAFTGGLYGPETSITNATILKKYLKKLQSGTSIKTMLHLIQIFKSKRFMQYDYGKTHNLKVYQSKSPPAYPLGSISCPVALFYSGQDPFLDKYSVERLARQLPNVIATSFIPQYNHIDLVFADSSSNLLYKKIIKQFRTKP